MASKSAPKQWQLTADETHSSFEAWKDNLLYLLEENAVNEPFLKRSAKWKKSSEDEYRGFTGDTKDKQTRQLERMLGQIANFCPLYSRSEIIHESTCLNDVWSMLKTHYQLQITGASILELCNIKLNTGEKYEDLFQRLKVFVESNLLSKNCGIRHLGKNVDTNESLSPIMQSTLIVLWLHKINPALPDLVKQKFATELRNQTLASIKPEISSTLKSLLDEISSIEESKACRLYNSPSFRRTPNQKQKFCSICKNARRPSSTHNTYECRFAQYGRNRAVMSGDPVYPDAEDDTYYEDDDPSLLLDTPTARSVEVMQSPYLDTHYNSQCVRVILDSGSTSSFIKSSFANKLGLDTKPARQSAKQADGVSKLNVKGEAHCLLTRGDKTFQLDALIVDTLDSDVLAGMPFMIKNDIALRPALRQIVVQGAEIVTYGQANQPESRVRRAQAFLLKAPAHSSVILPGEFVELTCNTKETPPDSLWAIEPRFDCSVNVDADFSSAWPTPQIVQSVDGRVRLTNNTQGPIPLKKYEQMCQARPIHSVRQHESPTPYGGAPPVKPSLTKPYSQHITIDPQGILDHSMVTKFRQLHNQYDHVFDPAISKYNGASGKIEAVVNMGPTLPPQRKGRLPQYNKSTLSELQAKFDELEEAGVFAKPENIGVVVEYLNISFLIHKPSGGTRLVTSFGEVANYSKPQPSLMPNVNNVLRDIGQWKYIIVSDLHHAFYQIPLSRDSRKFCGVATPYKGIRVYTRSAMGMPGSETSLEELMSRVLGDLVQDGLVAKLADDLYVGGQSPEEVLARWEIVLHRMSRNNLRLSAPKTVVCPATTTILGWIWKQGTISASPHRISALSSVDPPSTTQGLRSFIGAFKVLSRVLHGYADLLQPLEAAIAGKSSRDKISWNEGLSHAFKCAQSALNNCKTITLPHHSDILWIVTDASRLGIGATLYCLREGNLQLGGFFNAKLKQHQKAWLPCEIEALAITSSVRHFAPLIIQSSHQCQVLTDSKPCVQAYHKLTRGEFSASARVTTYLSILSRYKIHVRHIDGVANLPSDYASRHPASCFESTCQVCKFIEECETAVVSAITIKDVTDGNFAMPFTNRTAWLATQQECPDMRRTCAHLQQGTRPSKKSNRVKDVKRYLNVLRVARDGVLVATERPLFAPTCERIAVPRSVLSGLLTVLHIKFNHPSKYQLKQIFMRYFFALDLDRSVNDVTANCDHCEALKSVPSHLHKQSSEPPPERIGQSLAADVMRRAGQCVLVLRETVSSFTSSMLIDSESGENLKDGLITLLSQMQCINASPVFVRVDSAPGLQAIAQDQDLNRLNINLVYGHIKNDNKNPVAERAIQELGTECLNIQPEGGKVSKSTLALATLNMNSRIRYNGLSAAEKWTQRDQITGEQLDVNDKELIQSQSWNRSSNHHHSATSKSAKRSLNQVEAKMRVGDLVYIKQDRDKTQARHKYMITSITEDKCRVRKFTKNQFRARAYEIPLCDCYPIKPTVQGYDPHRRIRGLQYSGSSESSEDDDMPLHIQPAHQEVPGHRPAVVDEIHMEHDGRPPDFEQEQVPIPLEINEAPPVGEGELHEDQPGIEQEERELPEIVQPRRSTRRRRPNRFLHDGNWNLNSDNDTPSDNGTSDSE